MRLYASGRDDIHVFAFLRATLDKPDNTVRFCKQRVVAPAANIDAGVKMSTALPDQDIAGKYCFATVAFDAKAFGF